MNHKPLLSTQYNEFVNGVVYQNNIYKKIVREFHGIVGGNIEPRESKFIIILLVIIIIIMLMFVIYKYWNLNFFKFIRNLV